MQRERRVRLGVAMDPRWAVCNHSTLCHSYAMVAGYDYAVFYCHAREITRSDHLTLITVTGPRRPKPTCDDAPITRTRARIKAITLNQDHGGRA